MGLSCGEISTCNTATNFVDDECVDAFYQYFCFQEQNLLRDLSLVDYTSKDQIVVNPEIQIFPDEVFEIWVSCLDEPPIPKCYLTTDLGNPLYTDGEVGHLLLPGSCDV